MNTNMKPDFMAITAKVIAEVRNSTCIDDADVEILEGLLKVLIPDLMGLF